MLLEDACFDAQQAVEKALKDVHEASALTDDAVAARYPGPFEPVLLDDYERAVATAAVVVSWVTGIVSVPIDL